MLIELRDAAVASVDIQGSTFSGNEAVGFQADATDGSTLFVTAIGANSFNTNTDGIEIVGEDSSHVAADISGASFSGNASTGITVSNNLSSTSSSSLSADILNNTINVPTTGLNNGIFVIASGAKGSGAVSHFEISGNNITDNAAGGSSGIAVFTADGLNSTPNFSAVVTNNTLTMGATAAIGISLDDDADGGTAVYKVEGNTVIWSSNNPGNHNIEAIDFEQGATPGSGVTQATMDLEQGSSGPLGNNASVSTVEAILAANNLKAFAPVGSYAIYAAGTFNIVTNGTAILPPAPPTLTTPTVSGTAQEGVTLSASGAVSTGGGTPTFQWQESFSGTNFVAISGATGSTYTPTEADIGAQLRVVATTLGTDGFRTVAISADTAAVTDHLTVTQPAISGTTQVGQVLTASAPTVDNADATITYQWQRNGVNISGATGQTYRLTTADLGDALDVVATATDPHGGDTAATSAATGTVAAFTPLTLSNLSLGTILGNDKVTVTWVGTVNAQSAQLIVNPVNTGTLSGTGFSSVNSNTVTTTLDTLTLGGEIFNDLNGNGVLDAGELGIANVSLSVFAQGGTTALETTTTNASGDYDFTGLAAGNYVVQINASNFSAGGALANFNNASPVVDTNPSDYAGNKNYGLALSGGVIDTNPITIAYNAPHPSGATTYPGDDATNTLDIGLISGPSISAGATATFTGGGSPVTLDNGLTISDSTSTTLASATVSIGTGFISGDTLSVGTAGGLSVSYSAASGTLTLTGNAGIATYQTALDSITYSFSPMNGDPTGGVSNATSRTIDYVVNDGTHVSSQATSSLTVVHTAPTVMAGANVTFTGGGAAVTLDAGLILADPDSGNVLTSVTVSIGSGLTAGDTLNFTNTSPATEGNISVSSNANGKLVLTSSGDTATVAQWENALETVTYSFSPSNGDPTAGGGTINRTIDWTVSDGSVTHGTTVATSTLQIVHVPATVVAGATATFEISASGPEKLDSTLTVNDGGDSNGDIASATVKIGTGLISADDTLNFVNQNNITSSYNAATGTLTLTGKDTVADYQTALELITFNTSSTSAGTRTIDWTVNDGASHSTQVTSTVNVVLGPQITAVVGRPVNGGTVELQGTGLAVGDTIDLFVDGNTTNIVGTGTVLAGDTFDITTTTEFADGQHKFTATETNSSNPTIPASQPFAVEVDAVAPTGLAQKGTATNGGTIEFTGTGDASGDTITLYNGATVIGTGTAGANGAFDITTTANFADGTYTNITATDTSADSTQISGHSSAATAIVELLAPTGLTQQSSASNGGTIEFTGTGDAVGDTITLYNGATVIGSGTAGANGAFDITTTAHFADGTYSNVTATDTSADSTQISGHSSAATAIVESLAPTGLAQQGTASNGGTIEITGTGDASGDTITLYNGATVIGSGTAGAGGAFDITTTTTFADGTYSNVTATDTSADSTQISGHSGAATAIVELLAPTGLAQQGTASNGGAIEITGTGDAVGDTITLYNGATVIGSGTAGANGAFDITTTANFADGTYSNITATDTSADSTQISGHSSAATAIVELLAPTGLAQQGTASNGGTIEITGTGDAVGDTIKLYNGATVIGSGTAGAGGAFDITTTANFADGTYSNITATDTSADSTQISGHSGAATAIVESLAPTGLAQQGTATNGGTIEITGTGDAVGDTITLYNGATVIGTGTAGADGAFDITTTTNFADGTYSNITATDTSADSTQISGHSSAATAIVELLAPTGLAQQGTATNGGAIEITGTGDAVGDTITLYNGATVIGTGTAGADGAFDITTTAHFADGTYSNITATDTSADSTQISGHSGAATAIVESLAPTGLAQQGTASNGGTIEITGTGDAVGDTITLYNGATVIGTGTAGAGGAFDITTTANFPDGTYSNITATDTSADSTQISGHSSAATAVVESLAPTGLAQQGTATNGGAIEITGTGDAVGDTITLYNGATVIGSGTAGANGAFDIVSTASFADGIYPLVTATDTSADGTRVSAHSNALTVHVEPDAPVITTLVGQPLNNGRVELQGTGETGNTGDTVNLYADGNMGTIVGTGTVVGGAFDITTTATFTDGVHTFTAMQTDAANLSSGESTSFSVKVAPTLSAGSTVTYLQDGAPQQLDVTATADPGDPGGPLVSATISIGAGFNTGDMLNFTNQNGISGSYDAVHGVLTLSGSASIAEYNAALDSITFRSTSSNPSNDGADLTRTISWSVTNGNPSNGTSATVTSMVNVHAVPTIVAGANVNYQAGPGMSAVLDPALGAYDGTSLTGATVTIASGYQSAEVLSANTAGTNITASYSNGVLTLTGKDTPQDYQSVLNSVTISGGPSNSGMARINWQISDQNLTSKVATSTVQVTADLAPPRCGQVQVQIPANSDHGHFGDFSGLVTNAQFGGPAGFGFGAGNALYVIHSEVNATVADNGTIGFDLALNQLEAALGGDVVSITATLADGQPLPGWLHFDNDTGQFAGLVPDDIATGSIGPDGGLNNGQGGSSLPQLMTVEVVARDSKSNLAVIDFTIDLSTPTPHKGEKHGWNVLPLGPHREIAPLHAMDRPMDHVLWHGAPGLDADRVHAAHHGGDPAPAGRAGFSDQIKSHGWHAVAAQRMALLDSLRQGVAGWR